jgi:diaminopimelate epimerase
MKYAFFKYEGTGNDFIIFDDRDENFPADNDKLIEKLCHRRFGIGADGLILIRKTPEAAFEMKYFNADGKLGSMCGNGGRCAAHFAQKLGIFEANAVFLAYDGLHGANVEGNMVEISMGNVVKCEKYGDDFFMNTGSPHYVKFVTAVEKYPVFDEGKKIRTDAAFSPGGTNANFVEIKNDGLYIRTFERGVEDETLSCGTGVTAGALAVFFKGVPSPVRVKTLGGELEVRYSFENETFRKIFLKGSVSAVFEGFVEI